MDLRRLLDFHANRRRRFLESQRERSPVILLGTQKTGSTAIAALLAAATGRSVTLDIKRSIKDGEWQLRARQDDAELDEFVYRYRKEFSRDIIKEPALTYFAGRLRLIYPRARYVMIQRHPFETVRSVLNRLDIPGNLPAIRISEHPELLEVPAWQLALDSGWLGRPGGNYVAALAHRWDLAAAEYLENRQLYTLIRYEDFVADKQGQVEQLARRAGLEIVQDISSQVDRQFQPRGQPADSADFFGAENLGRIWTICGARAMELGYSL